MSVIAIAGGKSLHGSIRVPGSKNAALAVLSAVLLADEDCVLHNMPRVSDTRIKGELLTEFGVRIHEREGSVYFDCRNVHSGNPSESLVRSIRTSFYVLGPLLARIGEVRIPAPGGCKIGARPVDYHLRGLASMGATIDLVDGHYIAKAKRLHGADIYFDFPSAGATQHLMTAAVLADGITTIGNAAIEPEVTALAAFLNRIGAKVEGAGTSTITIEGQSRVGGGEFRIPDDRLQAGTYLLAAAITGGDITVTDLLPETQIALASKLTEAGMEVTEGHNWVRARSTGRLRAVKVKTMPYPGFPTDMQQPMSAALTLADGVSVIEETIYESRIGHIPELKRMGASIDLQGRSAIITGVSELRGTNVEASDLRAGAALVLAGLAANGETHVSNVHFIDRGYEDIEGNLSSLGASIERIETDPLERVTS